MCCILGGLRKNLRRDEQLESMRTNPSGFAIAVLRNRKLVALKRSLDKNEIMKIWDEAKDDDYIVTHSRIPSMGGMTANIDDCHLWEREGCLLAHNGTMTNMREIMSDNDTRTDSLVFFEDLFIPVWKSQGKNMNALVENVIKSETSGSRICIITPDGEVHYYGKWIQDHGCWMSNRSYKTYSTPSFYSTTGYGGYSYMSDEYDDMFGATYASKSEQATDEDYDGTTLDAAAGTDAIVRYMIIHYMTENLVKRTSREVETFAYGLLDNNNVKGGGYEVDEVGDTLTALMSADGTVSFKQFFSDTLPQLLDDPIMTTREAESLVAEFSSICEAEFCPSLKSTQKISDSKVKTVMLNNFYEAIAKDSAVARMLNMRFNTKADDLKSFVTAWKIVEAESEVPTTIHRSLGELAYLPDSEDYSESPEDEPPRKNTVKNLSELYKKFCKQKESK